MRNVYVILDGKPEGKSKRKWEDNIKMNIKEIGCEGVITFIKLRLGASGVLL
jgi:hypothetical protein